MSERRGGFLEGPLHAGWSLWRRGLTNGGQTSSPWLSADLPASPIQLLTPTPALLTIETFCWQPGSLRLLGRSGTFQGRLLPGWANLLHIGFMKSQFYHLLGFAAASASARCSARAKHRPCRPTTGNFLNDHPVDVIYWCVKEISPPRREEATAARSIIGHLPPLAPQHHEQGEEPRPQRRGSADVVKTSFMQG